MPDVVHGSSGMALGPASVVDHHGTHGLTHCGTSKVYRMSVPGVTLRQMGADAACLMLYTGAVAQGAANVVNHCQDAWHGTLQCHSCGTSNVHQYHMSVPGVTFRQIGAQSESTGVVNHHRTHGATHKCVTYECAWGDSATKALRRMGAQSESQLR